VRVASGGSIPHRGNRSGRAIPVTGGVVPIAIGASGGGGNTAVENGPQIPLSQAGQVRTPVFRLGIVASPKRADYRILAPGLDMAKLPAVVALGRGRQWVGSFNYVVAAIKEDRGRIDQSVSMSRGDVDHDGGSTLAVHGGGGVRVEVSGALDKEVLGIVDGGLNVREEEIVVIGEGV